MAKKVFAVLLVLSLVFAAGCGQKVVPDVTSGTTTAEQTTTTMVTTTTTSTITETTTAPEGYDVDAIRAALQAELLEDSLPKKIVDCTRHGNYLFIFCDPVLGQGEKEDDMGGWLYRYNLKTSTLERHYNRLPLSRYIILSETWVIGESGRLTGFNPGLPILYDLTFTEDGPTVHYISETYFAVGGEYSDYYTYTFPCRLLNAYADACCISLLYELRQNVGNEVDPSAAWDISFSDGSMIILFDDMEPGELSLGDLRLSNVFIESAELTEIGGKTAVLLKLTKYARYFSVTAEQVISPDTFSCGQYRYTMLRIIFTAGDCSDTDYMKWSVPTDSFENYMQRLTHSDAVLVTLPRP